MKKLVFVFLLIPSMAFADQFLSLSYSKHEGDLSIGEYGMEQSLQNISLSYLRNTDILYYGVKYDYLASEDNYMINQLSGQIGAGLRNESNTLLLRGLLGLGISYYNETSEYQTKMDYGPTVSTEIAVSYLFENVFVSVGYRYNRAMFTDGVKWNATDVRTDLVFSTHGPMVELGWRW